MAKPREDVVSGEAFGRRTRDARRPNGFFVVRAGGNAGVSYAGSRQATDTDGRAFPA
jgi:hypothetical protein